MTPQRPAYGCLTRYHPLNSTGHPVGQATQQRLAPAGASLGDVCPAPTCFLCGRCLSPRFPTWHPRSSLLQAEAQWRCGAGQVCCWGLWAPHGESEPRLSPAADRHHGRAEGSDVSCRFLFPTVCEDQLQTSGERHAIPPEEDAGSLQVPSVQGRDSWEELECGLALLAKAGAVRQW